MHREKLFRLISAFLDEWVLSSCIKKTVLIQRHGTKSTSGTLISEEISKIKTAYAMKEIKKG